MGEQKRITCPQCLGTGRMFDEMELRPMLCTMCKGSGTIVDRRAPSAAERAVDDGFTDTVTISRVTLDALRAEVSRLTAELARYTVPLTERQAHIVFCNAPTFDIMQAFQVDAAIREVRGK